MQGPSNRRKDFIDPKKWALKREQQKAEIRRLEAIQEKERRKNPQQRDFMQQSPRQSPRPSFSKIDLYARDNRVECFDAAGHLISVNGVPIGLDGEPIFEEIQDLKGNLISLNGVPIKEIEGFRGVIRDQNGTLLSVRGPPFREEIRNAEGQMLSINGAVVAENREDIKLMVRQIRELTGNKKKTFVSKLLTTVGAKSNKKTFKQMFVKRIQEECKATQKELKAEVKRAKKMEDYLKNQEKADKKAAEQETKQRAKLLEKELARMKKQKIKELEAKAKDRKKEQEMIEKEMKIGAEARKLAETMNASSTSEGIREVIINHSGGAAGSNDVGGGEQQLGNMVQTFFMKYSNEADKPATNDNGSYYTTSSSSEDEMDDPLWLYTTKELENMGIKQPPQANTNENTTSVSNPQARPEYDLEGDLKAIEEFENPSVKSGGALDKLKEEHNERMRKMKEEIRKKEEEKRGLLEKQKEQQESELAAQKKVGDDQDASKGKDMFFLILIKTIEN